MHRVFLDVPPPAARPPLVFFLSLLPISLPSTPLSCCIFRSSVLLVFHYLFTSWSTSYEQNKGRPRHSLSTVLATAFASSLSFACLVSYSAAPRSPVFPSPPRFLFLLRSFRVLSVFASLSGCLPNSSRPKSRAPRSASPRT